MIRLNREALSHLTAEAKLEIVPDASHLFPEPGAMEDVMESAGAWFETWLSR